MKTTKTFEEIYGEMSAYYAEKTGMELRGDGDMAVRLMASAAQIRALYVYLDWIKGQCFPQTAAGEYLEMHGQMRGIRRIGAEKAKGRLRFSLSTPAPSDTVIPAGTVCMTAGLVAFVAEEGLIPAGETCCTVNAEAEKAGASGNAGAGKVNIMTAPPVGVSACVNTEAFTGGCDEEDDESLRARILASYSRLPNGTNRAFYEGEAMSFPGVAAVLVTPRHQGVGTVKITAASQEGIPSAELLEELETHFNAMREICVDVTVEAPNTVQVDITLKIKAKQGFASGAVGQKVSEALEGYFSGGLLGKDLTAAELGRVIYAVDGVENYAISAPAGDISIEADELPVLGTLTVSEWS